MTVSTTRALLGLTTLAGSLLLLPACSDDCDPAQGNLTPLPVASHPDVILRDVHGDPLPVTATAPYSPRATCGRCHDVDTIANGYHFQQGRTDSTGKIDDRLTDDWQQQVAVLSPGMFGKW
jgi:hypothetical protein